MTLRAWRWTIASALLAMFIGWEVRPVLAAIPSDEMRKELQHTGNVNDFAKVLSPAERDDLEARCLNLRNKTGASLVIVTINSLQGGDIDNFANKLFNQWGIGQRGKNDGLLLLVAVREHKFRLEVGYGLEPIISDAIALRILNEELPNRFRQARYADGLRSAIDRLAQLFERGQPAALTKAVRPPHSRDLVMLLFGAFLLGLGFGSKVVPLCVVTFCLSLGFVAGAIEIVPPLLLFPMAIVPVLLGFGTGRLKEVAEYLRGQGYSRRQNYGTITWSKDYWRTTDVDDTAWSDLSWAWGRTGGQGDSGSSWTGGGYGSSSGGFGGGSFGGGSSGGGGGSGGW